MMTLARKSAATLLAALMATSSMATVSRAADTVTASVGGFAYIGLVYQDRSPGDDLGVLRDAEIHFNVQGTADNGLSFDGSIELEAATDAEDQIDDNWFRVSSPYGNLVIGGRNDAADNHEVGLFFSPGGIGYFDSDYSPLFSSNGGDGVSIAYQTPTIAGFQLEVSYAPDSTADGVSAAAVAPATCGTAGDSGLSFRQTCSTEHWSVGADWSGEFSGVELAVGAGYFSEIAASGNDRSAFNVGASAAYAGFTFGVFYDELGSQDQDPAIALGATYETGPWGFGLGYSTSLGGPENSGWGLWGSYAVSPGVVAYGGYEGNSNEDKTLVDYENTVELGLRLDF